MLNVYANNYKYSYSPKTDVVSSKSVSIKPFVVGDTYFMKKIALTKNLFALVDDEDYERLIQYNWITKKEKRNTYAYAIIDKKRKGMHRLVMDCTDPKLVVDHINHIGIDNRKENLRICKPKENSYNKRGNINSSSKYKGVVACRGKWIASIRYENKLHYLGQFNSEDEAAIAYNAKATEFYKEFACLNKIGESYTEIFPDVFINNRTELDFSENGEVWKDVIKYEGFYKVSNFGKVFNISKRNLCSLYYDKDGYSQVHLRKNTSINVEAKLHRVVALAFIPNSKYKQLVNHKNGIKTDNRVENLEWATAKENTQHALKNGLIKTGEDSPVAKFSNEDILGIKELRANGMEVQDIATIYSASPSYISRICMGKFRQI